MATIYLTHPLLTASPSFFLMSVTISRFLGSRLTLFDPLPLTGKSIYSIRPPALLGADVTARRFDRSLTPRIRMRVRQELRISFPPSTFVWVR